MKTPAEKAEKKLDAILGVYTLAEQIEICLEKKMEQECKTKGFVSKSTNNRLGTIAVRLLDLKCKLQYAISQLIWYGDDSQREYAEAVYVSIFESGR